jgi:serine protease Do
VARGFLGVQIQPVTAEIADAIGLKEARGALVAQAEPGSPAGKAGLRRGDTVLALDGVEVKDPRELTRRVGQMQPGASVALKVWRDGAERTVKVELGRQPRA